MTTPDAALVSIDARTGKQRWRAQNGDPAVGFQHTGGPVVAQGVVISGLNGCERFKKESCALIGRDPESGRELWRSEEHTSELQSLMRISYAVFRLTKKKTTSQ